MKKEHLFAQLEHIKEYVEVIDKFEHIEFCKWDFDPRLQSVALRLACKGGVYSITFCDIQASIKLKEVEP